MQSFPSKRAPAFSDIPDEKWNDWRWQLSHRLNSIEDFEQVFPLSEANKKRLDSAIYSESISPLILFLSLILQIPETPSVCKPSQQLVKFSPLQVKWKTCLPKTPIPRCQVLSIVTLIGY